MSDFEKIIYFENLKEAYGIPATRKMVKRYELKSVEFLGVFINKWHVKEYYPNTSISLSNDIQLSKYHKLLLNNIYRRIKIFNLLN